MLLLTLALTLALAPDTRMARGGEPFAWQAEPGARRAPLTVATTGRTGFTRVPPDTTGIAFTNRLSDLAVAFNRILENGSGVALGDVDGDGWCDLYFCQLEGDNVLYRNLGGWRFEDVTATAGVACPDQYSTGAALADVDGDGDLDLLVNGIGAGTRQFLNDGRGRFTELTGTRLVRRFGSTSMALADIDGDGDLDLYVANYRTTTFNDRPPGLKVEARMVDGRLVVTPEDRFIPLMPRAGGAEIMERGERDFLYLNDGTGRFLPVSWTSGSFLDEDGRPLAAPPTDWGLAVTMRDFNHDGFPDIYVCNDFFYWPDRLWLNDAGRRFRAAPRLARRHQSVSSMGIDVADLNHDGFMDFFVADMVSRRHDWRQRQRPNLMQGLLAQPLHDPLAQPEVAHNTLFLNRGDGTWTELAQLSGADATEWSWGALFLDVDLDGFEDLLIPTGSNRDVQDADIIAAEAVARRRQTGDSREHRVANARLFPPVLTPIVALRNRGDLTFEDLGPAWGFTAPGVYQGAACADLDHDGDLDLVVNQLNGPAALYRNDTDAPRLAVRLHGAPPNTQGIGALIRVLDGPVPQSQEMLAGGRYCSSDEPIRTFATGSATNRLTLEVTWRSGRHSRLTGVHPNHLYEIAEAAADVRTAPLEPTVPPPPLFRDASDRLRHRHVEPRFDDFERQPLLSRTLASLGPGVVWFDFDGDGRDDLFLGGGPGAPLSLLRNDGQGGFTAVTHPPWTRAFARKLTGLVACRPAPGTTLLLAGDSSYESPRTGGPAVHLWRVEDGATNGLASDFPASTGPLALGDTDGDGILDLFVGGRVVPGRYPEPATSRLYRGRIAAAGPTWSQADAPSPPALERVGLVSGALFTDLTGDGWPELVLACEWGALRLFRNERGRLVPWDPPTLWAGQSRPLRALTGWWHAVASGDFDGDGRLDLVAANWGRNTRFQRALARPLRLYYGDLAELGVMDLVEAVYDPQQQKYVPWRDFETLCQSFPHVRERIATFRAFGESSVEDFLGEAFPRAQRVEAVTLDSLVLLNRGDRLEARPLPVEAQFAPAFGLAVGDADGDGREDVFLSQNFFGVERDTGRYDGGGGLWLLGNGAGGFRAATVNESGLRVDGEQRGCAVADYDADGRLDLAIAQFNGDTRLFRNVGAKPGLRVRLAGRVPNPDGIGATVRLKFGDRWGPAREVQAGAGYWSQHSVILVLGTPSSPTDIVVRWPGGATTTSAVPDGARALRVHPHGTVERFE